MMSSWRRGQAYAQHLRERVLAATGTLGEVAERFGVSTTYVWRVRSRSSRLGQTRAGAQVNHVPPRLGALQEALVAQVAAAPEQTLAQLCCWVRQAHGVGVGQTTMHKTLKRLGLTLKKRACAPASSTGATSHRRAPTGPTGRANSGRSRSTGG